MIMIMNGSSTDSILVPLWPHVIIIIIKKTCLIDDNRDMLSIIINNRGICY